MDYIDLALRDKWQYLANTVVNLGVHKTRVVSGLSEELLAFQEGLCFVELSFLMHRQTKTFKVLKYMVIWVVFKYWAPSPDEIWCF